MTKPNVYRFACVGLPEDTGTRRLHSGRGWREGYAVLGIIDKDVVPKDGD